MIKAVIFDMDGLLIDSEPFWQESESKIFNSLGINPSKELLLSFMGKRIDEVVELMWKTHPWTGESKKNVVDSIVLNVINLISTNGTTLPGVISTLESCRNSHLKIGLASSSKMKIINTVIEKLQLAEYFDCIHSAEFEEYGKPHPQIFISTAKMLGVSPEECVVFEDSLNGVIAALAANMKCIAIPEKNAHNHNKFIIAHQTLKSLENFKLKDLTTL